MEIQEDYFQENLNFNKNQQKKILDKAKELLNEYNQKQDNNSISLSTNNSINNTINKDINIGTFQNEININDKINKEYNMVEIGIGNGDISKYHLENKINRCWNCFNKLKDNNYIEIKYEDSMITRIVRFCSEKCKNKFEMNIYEICDNCKIKYDKSKGDFIYQDKHFHSQKCLNEYMDKWNNDNKNEIKIDDNNNNIIHEEEQEDIYDPMDDF